MILQSFKRTFKQSNQKDIWTVYFFDNLKKYSERNAIITEHGERISYKELLNEISRVEKYITNKRTRVFLISDNNRLKKEFYSCTKRVSNRVSL